MMKQEMGSCLTRLCLIQKLLILPFSVSWTPILPYKLPSGTTLTGTLHSCRTLWSSKLVQLSLRSAPCLAPSPSQDFRRTYEDEKSSVHEPGLSIEKKFDEILKQLGDLSLLLRKAQREDTVMGMLTRICKNLHNRHKITTILHPYLTIKVRSICSTRANGPPPIFHENTQSLFKKPFFIKFSSLATSGSKRYVQPFYSL